MDVSIIYLVIVKHEFGDNSFQKIKGAFSDLKLAEEKVEKVKDEINKLSPSNGILKWIDFYIGLKEGYIKKWVLYTNFNLEQPCEDDDNLIEEGISIKIIEMDLVGYPKNIKYTS